MMKRMIVRYKTKPESADENERLIGAVFRELRAESPEGLRYLVLRLDDASFVHFVTVETEDGDSPLGGLAAFKAFQARIRERCAEPPQSSPARLVGNYRVLDEA
jgi:hypothetical protein